MVTPRRATTTDEALGLGPLADLLGYHVAQAAVITGEHFERHVGKPFDLRKSEFSLLVLLQVNGPLPPKRLAATLTLTAPNLTLMLDRLQERGLLRRERNPADGRSQHIVLTDKGRKLTRDAVAAGVPMERELQARLTKAQHAMLIELLGRLCGSGPGAA